MVRGHSLRGNLRGCRPPVCRRGDCPRVESGSRSGRDLREVRCPAARPRYRRGRAHLLRSRSVSIPRQVWPPDFAARYRQNGCWRGETLGGFLRERAARTPDHLAMVQDNVRWTYAQLDARADRLAAGLLALGYTRGDRVLVQLPNIPEFLSVVFGLFRAGLLPVFALPAHRHAEIEHFGRASGAVAYVVADTYGGFDYRTLAGHIVPRLPSLRHVIVVGEAGGFTPLGEVNAARPQTLPNPAPDDVAFLQLSGGSTGFSKLIPRTHDDYLYSVRESAVICGLDSQSVFMATLPVAHNYPMS